MFLSRIDVMVHFLPAMESHDQLRRTLAESSHDAIGTVLQQALTHPSCQPEGLDS
jgi:hypothetical protein